MDIFDERTTEQPVTAADRLKWLQAEAHKQIEQGYLPVCWIAAEDIIQGFADEGLPEPTVDAAKEFLVEHFDEISDSFNSDLSFFWQSIAKEINGEDSDGTEVCATE